MTLTDGEFMYTTDEKWISSVEKQCSKIEKDCKKFDYDCECYVYKNKNNENFVRLNVFEPKGYLPKLYISEDDSNVNFLDYTVGIQTTSYGELSLKEYPKFMNDCKMGYECADLLKWNIGILLQMIMD